MTFFLLLGALAFMARTVNAVDFEVLPFDPPTDWPLEPDLVKLVGPVTFILPTEEFVSLRVEGIEGEECIGPLNHDIALPGGGDIYFKNPPHNVVSEEFCAKVILDFGDNHPDIASLTIRISVSADGDGRVTVNCDFDAEATGVDNEVNGGVDKERTGGITTVPFCCPGGDDGTFYLGDPVEFEITSDYYIKVLSVVDGNNAPLLYTPDPAGDYTTKQIDIAITIPVLYYDLGSIIIKIEVEWKANPGPGRRRLAEPEPTSGTQTTETAIVLGVREEDKNSGATHIRIASTLAGAVALLI
jgi:hypothetical protein